MLTKDKVTRPDREPALTKDKLASDIENGLIDTVVVAFTDMQGRLMGKRIDAEYFMESAGHGESVEGCNYLLALDMEMDPIPGYQMANWESGYGDFDLVPDFTSLRRIPWLESTALVLCDVAWHDGKPVRPSPRQVLRAQVERARALGFEPMFGSELEFFLLKETYAEAHAKHYIDLVPSVPYILAPNINSYKRYAAGSWAPTTLAWGHDNRTCGFRIVGHGQHLRTESRIPGADVNPYLCFAALLAAGLHGVEQKLNLPPEFKGNAYESDVQRFPGSLRDAIGLLERGTMARQAFGDDVIDHYLNYARTEQSLFDKVVTNYERERLFERG